MNALTSTHWQETTQQLPETHAGGESGVRATLLKGIGYSALASFSLHVFSVKKHTVVWLD